MERRFNIRAFSGVTSNDLLALATALFAISTLTVMGVAQPLSPISALLAFIVLTGAAALSPTGAAVAIVVALPYFYRTISIGAQSFAPSELLLAATVAGCGVRLATLMARGELSIRAVMDLLRGTLQSRLVQVGLALALIGIVTVITGYDPSARGASLREWRWGLLEPLVFVAIITTFASRRNERIMLAGGLILAGFIVSLHGMIDLATDGGVAVDSVRRISGPLPHPNALALFLVKPLVFGAVIASLSNRWRSMLIVPVLIMAVVLFGTFSRGAMLAIAAAAVLVALDVSRRSVVAVGAAVVGVTGLTLIVARERMLNALEGGSVSLRFDIWSSASQMIRDRPVLGYGPDQFLYAYAPRYIEPTAWDERFTSHAHNLILDAWIRMGLPGALIAVLVILVVFYRLSTYEKMPKQRDLLQFGAIVALAATILHGLIDNAYFAHDLAMSSWLLAWLGFASPEEDRERAL
jgi:putative inorganic carbon (hco3(-)) transporter